MAKSIVQGCGVDLSPLAKFCSRRVTVHGLDRRSVGVTAETRAVLQLAGQVQRFWSHDMCHSATPLFVRGRGGSGQSSGHSGRLQPPGTTHRGTGTACWEKFHQQSGAAAAGRWYLAQLTEIRFRYATSFTAGFMKERRSPSVGLRLAGYYPCRFRLCCSSRWRGAHGHVLRSTRTY